MVTLAIKSESKWYAPLPLWAQPSSLGIQKKPFPEIPLPTIFRFDNDDFMEEFTSIISHDPKAIKDWIARYETWREPMPSPKPVAKKMPPDQIEFLYSRTKSKNGEKQSRQQQVDEAVLSSKQLKEVKDHDQMLANQNHELAEYNILKLYQPAQQRFYMVGASLVCDIPGYPDSSIDSIKGEKVTYVVRRLLPPTSDNTDVNSWDEYAFVEGEAGRLWQQVAAHTHDSARVLATGEEQYPMFPLIYKDHCQKERKILGGIIPVGKRESWLGAQVRGTNGATEGQAEEVSPLERLFVNDVIAPWKNMIVHAQSMGNSLSRDVPYYDENGNLINWTLYIESRDQLQTISWYVLLDFALFLERYLSNVWKRIADNDQTVVLNDAETELITVLNGISLSSLLISMINEERPQGVNRQISSMTLQTALVSIRTFESNLEEVDSVYERQVSVDSRWPDFLYPLADPEVSALNFPGQLTVPTTGLNPVEILHARLDKLLTFVRPLLDTEILAANNDILAHIPVVDKREAYFVIRCVYEKPLCGPLFQPLVSESSRMFHVASFFDPDAPTRPVRIPMPMDISPAGLRKYQKNTGFIISDMLCGKIKQIRELTFADLVLSVLPWPFHKGLPEPADTGPCKGPSGNIGMICSLSIPIVTLCALILLIIIVALFDLFFKWIPLLFVCLPIPGLKGKK